MFEDIFLRFISLEAKEHYPSLVVSRIKNINSICFSRPNDLNPSKIRLKFNFANGDNAICDCLYESDEKLYEMMGPLARFDILPGIHFNCKNLVSFTFIKKEKGYDLNMSYREGTSDCFDVGEFSFSALNKIPCSEFFEEEESQQYR